MFKKELKQGAKANKAGKTAEDTIYCIFKERGYIVRRQHSLGISIYGHSHKCDFFIEGLPGYYNGLIIESKWQTVAGSVDEKYPYLVENIKTSYPCPTIIMADGGGMKPGALKWLKDQVDDKQLIEVFTFAELMKWIINNNF